MITGSRVPRGLARLCACILPIIASAFAHAQSGPAQRVIVKYSSEVALRSSEATLRSTEASIGRRHGVSMSTLRTTATGARVLVLEKKLPASQLKALVAELAATPGVEYAEEDQLLQPFFTPNDPRYNEQWHYFESTAGINLPGAWDISTGAGVVVAVVDTGYRPHPDLAANVLNGYDFISDTFTANDGGGRDSDATDPGDWVGAGICGPARNSSWHGTHVAGTIAAVTNNGTGVAGVAFNARVLPVRVLGRCGGFISDIADGVIWASGGSVSGVPANPNPARVINMSLGGQGGCSSTLQNAIFSATSRSTVVIVAAGNENQNAANVNPANCSGVITVAAINRAGGKAFYSNFGPVVDIAAPGGDLSGALANGVLSTLNTGATTPAADHYDFYQGTSMATPHVSGVAALVLSANGLITPVVMENLLKSTARPFPGACSGCGAGIVNAARAAAGYVQLTDVQGNMLPYAPRYSVSSGCITVLGLNQCTWQLYWLNPPSTRNFVWSIQGNNGPVCPAGGGSGLPGYRRVTGCQVEAHVSVYVQF